AGVGGLAGGHLQRGEQRGGAVALVVVGGLLPQPGPQRQDRRGPVQRLDLTLLVQAQHDRVGRRGQVQPDHVAHPGLPFRVRGDLERLPPPPLPPVFSPCPRPPPLPHPPPP